MDNNIYLRTVFLCLTIVLAVVVRAGEPAEVVLEDTNPLDEVLMKDGSRIFGTVISARDGVIELETSFAGTLKIDSLEVEYLNTQGSMVVLLVDGSVIRDQPVKVEKSGLLVTADTGDTHTIGREDFKILNPEPWELGEGYKSSGLVNFALVLESGNSDTEELDYKLESYWRSLKDRYTIEMFGEIDEANGIKSSDNWDFTTKYDYFSTDDDYWGGKVGASQDEFADLDLRAYFGPYYGRQFYETPILTLSGELGVSYVSEDFIVAEDQEYPGAHWDVRVRSNYLGGDSSLYVNQIGIWNLKDTEDVILNTTLGLSFPLMGSLEAAAEIYLEFDSGAVDGIEELDQTYRLRIGYSW